MKTAALITAAGMSSRMGTFKPLLPIGDISIAKTVISTLRASGVSEIVVVTGNRRQELMEHLSGLDIRFVHNADYAVTRMFDSVKLGMTGLQGRCDRFLFTPIDVPLFSSDTVKKLIASDAQLASPLCNGKTGHPVLISENLIPLLLSDHGGQGLKGALSRCGAEMELIEVADPGILQDADTPEDYKRLVNIAESLKML